MVLEEFLHTALLYQATNTRNILKCFSYYTQTILGYYYYYYDQFFQRRVPQKAKMPVQGGSC